MTNGDVKQFTVVPVRKQSHVQWQYRYIIPRLYSDLLRRQRCLQWCNGSLITRYQRSATDACFTGAVVE